MLKLFAIAALLLTASTAHAGFGLNLGGGSSRLLGGADSVAFVPTGSGEVYWANSRGEIGVFADWNGNVSLENAITDVKSYGLYLRGYLPNSRFFVSMRLDPIFALLALLQNASNVSSSDSDRYLFRYMSWGFGIGYRIGKANGVSIKPQLGIRGVTSPIPYLSQPIGTTFHNLFMLDLSVLVSLN